MKRAIYVSVLVLAVVLSGFGGYYMGYYQSLHTREATALDNRVITLDVKDSDHEAVWSAALAELLGGEAEYRLPDRTRVDVLTDRFAVEVDWVGKFEEGIGQALSVVHYVLC